MKKLSILFFILVASGISLLAYKPEASSKNKSSISKEDSTKEFQRASSPNTSTLPLRESTEEALIQASSIEELEKQFSGLSDKEINIQIKKNNQMAKNENLFKIANADKLDATTSKKMVEFIRVNRVLYQILLERQIQEIERDVL